MVDFKTFQINLLSVGNSIIAISPLLLNLELSITFKTLRLTQVTP